MFILEEEKMIGSNKFFKLKVSVSNEVDPVEIARFEESIHSSLEQQLQDCDVELQTQVTVCEPYELLFDVLS